MTTTSGRQVRPGKLRRTLHQAGEAGCHGGQLIHPVSWQAVRAGHGKPARGHDGCVRNRGNTLSESCDQPAQVLGRVHRRSFSSSVPGRHLPSGRLRQPGTGRSGLPLSWVAGLVRGAGGLPRRVAGACEGGVVGLPGGMGLLGDASVEGFPGWAGGVPKGRVCGVDHWGAVGAHVGGATGGGGQPVERCGLARGAAVELQVSVGGAQAVGRVPAQYRRLGGAEVLTARPGSWVRRWCRARVSALVPAVSRVGGRRGGAGRTVGGSGELDPVGLSWSSWDVIQNVHRADQAHSETTDATRTAGGLHAVGNLVSAGQWLFRLVGMGSL
jgi:hypothetical protein